MSELSKSAGVFGDLIVYFEIGIASVAPARVALDSFRLGGDGGRESRDGDLDICSSFGESIDLLRFGKIAWFFRLRAIFAVALLIETDVPVELSESQ